MADIATREQAESVLAEPGRRRREALALLAAVDAELRPLIRPALATGIGLARVREITGLSVTTLRLWRDNPEAQR